MTSTTSTTQSHSAQTAAARAQAANPRKPGTGGHGQEASPDLFAAMLSLLSATPDIPPDLPPDTAADDTDPQALSAHDLPTDHLLGWSGAAGTAVRSAKVFR
jgi:hypothetical protein